MTAVAVLAVASADRAAARPQCSGSEATQLVDPKKLFAVGTKGDDVIAGTRANEKIKGRRGDDRGCGHGGRDVIKDGPGADRVRAGSGRDRIRAGKGKDRLSGGTGRDKIKAADGARDRVRGGKGRDKVNVRDGVKDSANCGPGRDTARIDNSDVLRSCNRVKLDPNPSFALPSWSDGDWSDASTYETIVAGDLDGDGVDELLGRSAEGIEANIFCPSDPEAPSPKPCGGELLGQWLPLYPGGAPALADAAGWTDPAYYSTIQAADVDGDGKDELLARGPDGLHAWRFSGESASCGISENSGCWTELPKLENWSDANNWNQQRYYSTIQTANLTGGDEAEVFARGPNGVEAWRLSGGSWANLAAAGPWDDAHQWDRPQYYATIHPADLLGDAHEELYGRASDGLHVYQLAEPGWDFVTSNTDLADQNGWTNPTWYSTIQTGNLDGDGYDEVLGRARDGVHSWQFENGRWTQLGVLPAFEDVEGGNEPQSYSTIQTARLAGALPIDFVIGRGSDGLQVYWTAGSSSDWEKLVTLGDLSDAAGWDAERYYSTITTVDGLGDNGGDAVVGRGLVGIQSYEYVRGRSAWASFSAQFPTFDTAEAHAAYADISNELTPGRDLREQYPSLDTHDFDSFRTTLATMAQPPDVHDSTVWKQVKGQIDAELANGGNAADWYDNYLTEFTTEVFDATSFETIADRLAVDANSDAQLVMREWKIAQGVFTAAVAVVGAADPEAAIVGRLVSGAVSAGLGTPRVNDAIAGIEGAYANLDSRLKSDFTAAVNGLGQARSAINGDYGLQTAVGDALIRHGRWTQMEDGARDRAVAASERTYATTAWQALTPAAWAAVQVAAKQDANDFYCPSYCQYQVDGRSWQLAYSDVNFKNGPGDVVTQGLKDLLFGQPSSTCEQNWDFGSCAVGVPVADVFRGSGDWAHLQAWTCDVVTEQIVETVPYCTRQR